MRLSKSAVLAIGLVVMGCGPRLGSSEGQGDEGSSSSDGTGGSSETGTDPTTETDTGTGSETETGLEPDLPPEPDCAPHDEAKSFDELCFAEPLQIDSAAVNFVDWFDGEYYVAGPDNHRLFVHDQFDPVPEPESLAISGTTVGALRALLFEEPAPAYYIVATKDPHAVVVLSLTEPVEIVATVPLPHAPLAIAKYTHEGIYFNAIAVSDAGGYVQLLDPSDGVILESIGSRELFAPANRLHGAEPWDMEWGGFGSLVGLTLETSSVVLMQPPILNGPEDWWALGPVATAWALTSITDTGGVELLLFTGAPVGLSVYPDFGADADFFMVLDHPIHDWRMASERWGGPQEDSVWEHYGLSISDARLSSVGTGDGEGTSFTNPRVWLEVPEGTVDFLPIGKARFLCASMSSGLNLLAPLP